MALFWRSSRTEQAKNKNTVPTVEANQPLNPFTEIQVFTDHTDIVRQILKVDATRCVSSSDDCTVILWDVELGILFTFIGHSRPVTCMLYYVSENTELLATGSSDKTIRIWNLHTGECVQTVTEHASNIKCLVSITSSELFCSASEELCLWDIDWKIVHKIKPNEDVQMNHLLVLSDERLVVSAATKLTLYKIILIGDVYRLQILKNCLPHHRENIRCLVSISDSVFCSASLDGAISVWSTHALNCTQELNKFEDYKEHYNFPHSVQYLLPIQERYVFAAIANGFSLYDVFTGKCLVNMSNAHFSSVTSLAMIYGGEFLASSSEDGTIRLWGCNEKHSPTTESTSEFKKELSHFFGNNVQSNSPPKQPYQPSLLGQCMAHSGAINAFLDCGREGLVSCGADSLLIMWKDGIRQSSKRNNLIRESLLLNGCIMDELTVSSVHLAC
ncbi:WD repeat-containing protein 41-like [Antedon mediterranea]|uniref:WD repeat-containing protein 41-like n=1 Tax=Antedon mediterranea TaxID=105859 RepID=UPI003AF96B3C